MSKMSPRNHTPLLSNWEYAQKHYWPKPQPVDERIASLTCRGAYAIIVHYHPHTGFAVPTTKVEVDSRWGALHATGETLCELLACVTQERLSRLNDPLANVPIKVSVQAIAGRIDAYTSRE